MGAFGTGFLTAFGNAAKKKADERSDANVAQKKSQADIYWGVIKNPDSTPEQINYAHDQLGKLYPKDPELKQLFDKFRGMIQQTHPGHQQAQDPNADPGMSGMAKPGGIPAPPQPPGAAPAGTTAPTATGTVATPAFNPNAVSAIPKPPQPPTFADMAHRAAGPSSDEQDARKLKTFAAQEKIKHEYKMAEVAEAAKAKAANPTGRATAISPISMSEARKMAAAGQTFAAADGGDPLTLDDYDDTMMLVPLQQNGKIVGYSPASQRQTHLTYNNKVIAVPSLNQMDANVAGKELGAAQVGSTTHTTDPATGQTTTAVKTPNVPAAAGGATTTPAPKPAGTPATAPPAKSAPIAKSSPHTAPSTPSATPTQATPRGLPPLDADGHVPSVAGTPQVVEGANQLLDGQDVNKLPAKTRDLSAQMARKYGWEQGKFTPKEQTMLREATTFIDDAMKDDSLKVLDKGFMDRQKVARVVDSVDNKGNIVSSAITTFAAQNLDEDDAAFVRMYNQLVGTISGFGQLVRSGRATEASIERLKRELPNPLTTKDSKDAMARLQRLRKEINVGLEKGTFTGATGTTRKSAIPAPPKPGGPSAGNVVHWKRDDNGNPVPAP